jgi:hypothetical protein
MAQVALLSLSRPAPERTDKPVVFLTASARHMGRTYANTIHGAYDGLVGSFRDEPKIYHESPSSLDKFYERGSLQNNLKSVSAKKILAESFVDESRKRAERKQLFPKVLAMIDEIFASASGSIQYNKADFRTKDIVKEGVRLGVIVVESVGTARITKKGHKMVNKLTMKG